MKVWLKLLAGAVLGIILGCVLPEGNAEVTRILTFLEKFFIGFGRYTVMPALVFSLIVAIYELREDRRFWSLLGGSCVFLLVTSAVVIAAGVGLVVLVPPGRVPILIEEKPEILSLDVGRALLDIFPSNMFSVFAGSGAYLLPVCVFAFYLAMGLSFDKNYTKPVIQLIDSLSRIFYHILSFFSEILSAALIVLAAFWAVRFRAVLASGEYRGLLIFAASVTLVLGCGVPCVTMLLFKEKDGRRLNPARLLYANFAPALAAFFSGDINFSLHLLIRHNKENSGIRRRANALVTPLFAVFGRAGSAMLAAVAFIVIIRSYSMLDIEAAEVLKIAFSAFGISLVLGRHPGDGFPAALAALAALYGHGYESSFLLLKPVAFFMIACGTFIDVQIAAAAAFASSRLAGFQEDKLVAHYI